MRGKIKEYWWLILPQIVATIADLYACRSISGRSMLIPVVAALAIRVKEKLEGLDNVDKH